MSSDAWAHLLRAGASAFNAARTAETLDLRGANLDGVALGDADLSGADLTGASLKRAVLTACKLDGAKLSAAHAAGADFSGNTLRRLDLTRAHLEDASFDRTTLEACELDDASAVHARFTDAVLRSMSVRGARFDQADFAGARFDGVTFTECSLADARLIGAAPRVVDCRSRFLLGPTATIDLDESWTGISGELGELRFVELARSACALLGRGFERTLSPTPIPGRDLEETRTRYGSPEAGLLVDAWHTSLAIEAFGLTPGNAFRLTVAGPDRVLHLRVGGPGVSVQRVRERIGQGVAVTA